MLKSLRLERSPHGAFLFYLNDRIPPNRIALASVGQTFTRSGAEESGAVGLSWVSGKCSRHSVTLVLGFDVAYLHYQFDHPI